ncbi:MAG: Dna2/Cas4 domain-containing protein [Nitrosomonas sp.]|uniref:CRISPR/Cas system-associated exonuclease Cas4, RecB family n=1 Tax=Nitrosomonas aestuarii TaxID=52441 RepID=A0A1I4DIG3_9PROT|nr:Dna2/Cas4 domain-containing protein [Nitrosomonas aestuarii]MBX3630314.1 Dna2/Cas4 domain-containing protein [Nitrosomonas sp.]SFK93302.1 CRISPR/Cas system-associated exonuclease Cas4, RecB family [Nitrosomonas aestuarii]
MIEFFDSIMTLILIAAAIWVFMIWRGLTQDWMPKELRVGRIVMIEEDLRTRFPFAVVGRPDQVYQLENGLHVPVENKNRSNFKIHETDIAQLSLQAWLLRRNRLSTTHYGYVAINNRKTGKRRAIRVDLLDDKSCGHLITRYLTVISHKAQPEKNMGVKCSSCGHRAYCY